MAFQPSMFLYNNLRASDANWSVGCSRSLLADSNLNNNHSSNNRSASNSPSSDHQTNQQQHQSITSAISAEAALAMNQQQQQLASALLIHQHQEAARLLASAAVMGKQHQQQVMNLAANKDPYELDEEEDEDALEEDGDAGLGERAGEDDEQLETDDDLSRREQQDEDADQKVPMLEGEQETALNLSLHSDRNQDQHQLSTKFSRHIMSTSRHLNHLRGSSQTSAAAAVAAAAAVNKSFINAASLLVAAHQQQQQQQSELQENHHIYHEQDNHSGTNSKHLAGGNSCGASTAASSSSSSSSSRAHSHSHPHLHSHSSSASSSSGWSSAADSLTSCSPERAGSLSSPLSLQQQQQSHHQISNQPQAHLNQQHNHSHSHQHQHNHHHHHHSRQPDLVPEIHRPLFIHHHHRSSSSASSSSSSSGSILNPTDPTGNHSHKLHHLHHDGLGPVHKADSDDLDRIRNFIEQFKARRGALGLTQKQAAQCFRAYTNDRYAFSDNFVGHFEGFQFRPQTAMTIADSLAEWLEFAENETRNGRQLSFMAGKVKETRKRKYEVIRIRDSAKRVLVEAFEKNKSPSTSELEQLSRKTNIPSRNIEIFFKNRRTSRQYHQ